MAVVFLVREKGQTCEGDLVLGIVTGEVGKLPRIAWVSWALAGACPGPMFILLGHGVAAVAVVIFGAILGALLHGLLKNKLPR